MHRKRHLTEEEGWRRFWLTKERASHHDKRQEPDDRWGNGWDWQGWLIQWLEEGRRSMNAREKLNGGYISICLGIACVAGWLTGSWAAFVIVLILMILCNFSSGNIRSKGPPV